MKLRSNTHGCELKKSYTFENYYFLFTAEGFIFWLAISASELLKMSYYLIPIIY